KNSVGQHGPDSRLIGRPKREDGKTARAMLSRQPDLIDHLARPDARVDSNVHLTAGSTLRSAHVVEQQAGPVSVSAKHRLYMEVSHRHQHVHVSALRPFPRILK